MLARSVKSLLIVGALAAVAPLAAQKAAGPTLITGTVLGSDGKPMRLAHAHIRSWIDGATIARATAIADGRFALAVTRPGAYLLEFTGVDHKKLQVPLVTGRKPTIALDARLERSTFRRSLDSVAAIGDWNHFDRSSARPLVKQADGRYTLDVESSAEEVAYQLVGITTDGQAISGTDASRYVYNEENGYRSVLAVQGGTATIMFDPQLLDRTPSAAKVAFRDRSSFMARAYEIFSSAEEWGKQYGAAIRAAREKNEAPQYDWKPAERDFLSRLARERDSSLRELILSRMLDFTFRGGARLDTATAGRIARELTPASIWWVFLPGGGPGLIMGAFQQAADPKGNPGAMPTDSTHIDRLIRYIDRAIAENPERSVQATALAAAVDVLMGQRKVERANQYYDQLKREYPEYYRLGNMKARFAPDRALRPGAMVPDYRFAALEDSSITFTNESMRGKVYLIDFWGSWCTGCVQEMPYLHDTYERFASKGFEILSVGVNEPPASIAKYRLGPWKMPWLHTTPTTFGSGELRPFEIVFVPRAVLVDREGKIIAVDEAVRGERLKRAVEEALK
jgi:thiol-disulfide isomerase/thioredoxin